MPTETVTKVVDASAILALALGEQEASAIAARLAGARLFAPALLPFELANVFATKIRRQPQERDRLIATFHDAMRTEIETLPVDQAGVLELAETSGLTAYDASYLWLARHLGSELITLDGQLAKAAAAVTR